MGRQLPVVKFLNGREQVITPERFTSDVVGAGTCKRMQASNANLLSFCNFLSLLQILQRLQFGIKQEW